MALLDGLLLVAAGQDVGEQRLLPVVPAGQAVDVLARHADPLGELLAGVGMDRPAVRLVALRRHGEHLIEELALVGRRRARAEAELQAVRECELIDGLSCERGL